MKLPLGQLTSHLERGLGRCYLIAADEPLLVGEATDEIRRAAIAQGFVERQLHFVERSFRWDGVLAGADSLSLFADRRIVEIRMSSPRPGDVGAKAIRELAEAGDPDRLIIISIQAKLDQNAQKSVWVRTVEKHGIVVDIRSVTRENLPAFIDRRARQRGLRIDRDAAELLADRVEGNLLAADQELAKFELTADDRHVDAEAVLSAVATSARFDVYRLGDAVVAGDLERALRVLEALRIEGVPPPLVAWALAREVMQLADLKAAAAAEGVDRAMARLRVWQSRQPALKRALARYSDADLARLVVLTARVDRAVKGVERIPAWGAITDLVLELTAPRSGWRAA